MSTPMSTLRPTPSSTPATPPAPIWAEEFSSPLTWGRRWVGDTTSAYEYGNHNPNDNKLDWLDPSAVSVADGVATFTARPGSHTLRNGRRAWTTGLLTTEGSQEGFQVTTGDHIETRVQLPTGQGAWPALWTWKDGDGEIDSFEYHPDNPNLLELSNHVGGGGTYYTDANLIKPGGWVTVGTTYGEESVDWYVGGVKVFSDDTGVGVDWSAYLILNLSVCAGRYHPAPSGSTPITFAVDYLRVYRAADPFVTLDGPAEGSTP
ncbi:glycoside hydrolase family 16 protein [Streptacidiphilus anmyonensis]|uniref:glycoside hydrolase family 16 protein n=1 Tax=Streptacidiphilus anmyonensis TaxID=405782 RepID=UPI001F381466|nr:glycoside hydrolase family 16 protein [Streptacidiphilus anmyonensis]